MIWARWIELLKVKSKSSRVFSRSKVARRRRTVSCFCAPLDLVFEEPLEEVDVRGLLLDRLPIAELEGVEDAREAELLELRHELMGRHG